jgi:hypothetical protein
VIPKNPTYISITKTGFYIVGEPVTLDQLGGALHLETQLNGQASRVDVARSP